MKHDSDENVTWFHPEPECASKDGAPVMTECSHGTCSAECMDSFAHYLEACAPDASDVDGLLTGSPHVDHPVWLLKCGGVRTDVPAD